MSNSFQALVLRKSASGFSRGREALAMADLPSGDVTVRVAYSGVNYKDALAGSGNERVVRAFPMVPGIDLAGTVIHSDDARFNPGDAVIATSYGIGVSHFGGFAEYARLPAEWLIHLPDGLTLRESMIFGTAGFTAALAVQTLQSAGLSRESGPVLVTGATGGVGSLAVAILSMLGYDVHASTGKSSETPYLRHLGASEILPRDAVDYDFNQALEKEHWAGVIDSVGGSTLASVLRSVRYGGKVAAIGLAGGAEVQTSVFPFILRGVSLFGIDSVQTPMEIRRAVWQRLAGPWKPRQLHDIVHHEADLDALCDILDAVLQGRVRGRALVKLSDA